MTNILSVARLEHRNGIDVVIDAFARLAREQPNIRLSPGGRGAGTGAVRGAEPPVAGVDLVARDLSRRRLTERADL